MEASHDKLDQESMAVRHPAPPVCRAMLVGLLACLVIQAHGQTIIPHPPPAPVIIPAMPLPATPPPIHPLPLPAAVPLLAASPSSRTSSGPGSAWALFDGRRLYIQGRGADQLQLAPPPGTDRPALWYRRGGTIYLSHDKTLVEQAIRIVHATPGNTSALASRRQALLDRQWRIATEQGEIANQQSDLAIRQARRHRAWIDRLRAAHPAWLPRSAASVGPAIAASSWPADQAAMATLNARQQALLREMEASARQQRALASRASHQLQTPLHADASMEKLLDQAIREGRARPLRP